MTATYWQVGRHIVEFEQAGERRAGYGRQLLDKLSGDLNKRFGRGFSTDNLETMRLFYLAYLKAREISETPSRKFNLAPLAEEFPLSWSHYVMLVRRSRSPEARAFYETEALRGGWSVRQLDRQMSTLFYERTALARNKAAMLRKGARTRPSDRVTPEEEIKHPLVLEFLGLQDEYSETELEDALIRHLETFLLELGGDLAFIGRQRRLRIGGQWYRVDLRSIPASNFRALPQITCCGVNAAPRALWRAIVANLQTIPFRIVQLPQNRKAEPVWQHQPLAESKVDFLERGSMPERTKGKICQRHDANFSAGLRRLAFPWGWENGRPYSRSVPPGRQRRR